MSNYTKNIRQVSLKAAAARALEFLPKDSVSLDKLEEWAYRAYESIAPREVYQTQIKYVPIVNNQGPVPTGIFDLEMVMFRELDYSNYRPRTGDTKSTTIDTETTTDVFTGETEEKKTKTTIHTEVTTKNNLKLFTDTDMGKYVGKYDDLDSEIKKHQIYFNNVTGNNTQWKPLPLSSNVFHNNVLMERRYPELYRNCKHAFSIHEGCFVTSFQEGELAVAYTTLPTNEEGEYFYPDYEYVSAALESALMKSYWKWQMNTGNVNGAAQKYRMFSQEYEMLATKASGALMMPDFIQYQNLRNMNKFFKEDSPFSTALGALNSQENLYFQNPTRFGNFSPFYNFNKIYRS